MSHQETIDNRSIDQAVLYHKKLHALRIIVCHACCHLQHMLVRMSIKQKVVLGEQKLLIVFAILLRQGLAACLALEKQKLASTPKRYSHKIARLRSVPFFYDLHF